MTNDNTTLNADGTVNLVRGPNGELIEEVVSTATRIREAQDIRLFANQNLIRSAKFIAQFNSIPSFAINETIGQDLRKLSYLCDSIEFPGQTLTAVDYRIPGKLKVKIPYLREISEVNLTFYISDKIPLFKVMSDWIGGISPNTAQNKYFDDIVGSIVLKQFEDTTNLTNSSPNALTHMTIKLIDLYPLNVQSMPANWMDDGYHKVNVSFYFRDLEITV
jgi:hypothetical protein